MTAVDAASPAPAAEATALSAGARVAHLLAVARREFIAHGYAHVSVDAVARRAGVSKETIYRNFPDKRALFEAAIEGLRDAFSSRIEHLDDEAGTPRAMLARVALAVQDSVAAGGHLASIWLTIAIARDFPPLAARLRADDLARLEPVRAALERIARARGVPGAVGNGHAADLGSLAVEGARHVMGWAADKPADRAIHADAVAALFLDGCLAADGGGSGSGSGAPMRVAPSPDPPLDPPAPPPAPRADHISALMAVARHHFFTFGFRGASLDQVGSEARVGRGTLYRHFDGKAGLFEAVMLDAAHVLAEACAREAPALDPGVDPQVALLPFVRVAGRLLNGIESVALHRTVIAEAKRAPRLARQVYAASRLNFALPLSAYLAAGAAEGRFRIADPDWHARQLLTLATEGTRVLSAAAAPGMAQRERVARRAVATFLKGFTAALD